MVLEIERKFVLDGVLAIEALQKDGVLAARKSVVQFYTHITPLEEIRFRKSNENFTITKKIGKGMTRQEFEEICDEKTYKKALKNAVVMPIEKTRFEFKINNLPANIDLYSGVLEGLATLEIEFLKVADAQEFKMPEFLQRHIKAEITEDERYKNKNLALFGLPEPKFNIKKALEILDANSDIKLCFPSSMRAIDASCVMFFQIYKNLTASKNEYEKSKDEEALHQIRVALRKTRSMLKILRGVFHEKTTARFVKSFKILANATNKKRDLDVFLDFLNKQKGCISLGEILLAQKKVLDDKILNLLTSKECDEVFCDWEAFLREESDFFGGIDHDKPIKKVVARAMREQILRLKKSLFELNEECENAKFHNARIEIKKLRYLLEGFIDLFGVRALQKVKTRSKSLQESFGELQDSDIWLEILDEIQDESVAKISAKLKGKIYKRIFKLREEILDQKPKFMRNLGKASRSLKIYYT